MFMAATLAQRARRKTLNGTVAGTRLHAAEPAVRAGGVPAGDDPRACTALREPLAELPLGPAQGALERSMTEAITLRFPPPRDQSFSRPAPCSARSTKISRLAHGRT